MLTEALIFAGTFVTAAAMTGGVRRLALAKQILDVPNERSSHARPTPRGGGLAIVVASTVAFLFAWATGRMDGRLLLALVGPAVLVAVVGWIDDRRPMSAALRLLTHVIAACVAVATLDGVPPLQFGRAVVDLGWLGHALGVTALVWTLNLFNFMDGIDGIAASEAVFVTAGGALLLAAFPGSGGVSTPALIVAAGCSGFLLWNWPPARIFMGDVGSAFLGFVIAVLALAGARNDASAPFIWLTLGGVFFVDATVTLLRRLARGRRPHEAHRTHAYQWLARRWKSHRRVTLAVLAVDFLWLLPVAMLMKIYPLASGWWLLLGLAPLVVVALIAGAGQPESETES